MANTAAQTTNISVEIIDSAIAACNQYISAADQAFAAFKGEVASLKGTGAFIGEASDGFDEAFAELTPMLTTDLTDTGNEGSVIRVVMNILTSVRSIIMEQQDPALGKANRDFVAESDAVHTQTAAN
ncbi:MAG: hypothetical protein IJ412_02575 [Oscillospiraceae bacterium]|nr:hypothetical protein [Oscillospiraceae bacterium]